MTSIARPPLPRATRGRIASCAALALTLLACGGDDDDDAAQPDAAPTVDGAPGDDAAPGSDAAYLVVSRVVNPNGRNAYVTILADLEPAAIDLSQALELSGLSRAFAFDGAIFTMDGETGQIARYAVAEDLTLSETARFSMMNEGVTSFTSAFAFISPTRAYYVDAANQQVVVWNPTDMVITGSFEIPGILREGYNVAVEAPQVGGNRVISPIGWSNLSNGIFHPAVGLLILDAQSDQLVALLEDSRCAVGGGGFFDEEGDFYVIGDNSSGVYEALGPDTIPDACLLRLRAGADAFDPDYDERVGDLADNPYFAGLDGTPDRRLLTRGWDPSVDPTVLTDARDYFDLKAWFWRLIDLDTRARTDVDLPAHVISFGPFAADGEFLLPQFDDAAQETVLYRLSDTQPVESVTSPGEIQNVERIR